MKPTLIVESGVIGEDGKLRLPMDRVEQFCREHPGERAIIKIEALERHSTPAMFGYYFGYILPTLREAFYKKGVRITEKELSAFLWDNFPGFHNPDQDIRQAPMSQIMDFIEWLKQYAAENLDSYIEDPQII